MSRRGIAGEQCEKWEELLGNRGGTVGESYGENRGVNHGGTVENPWGDRGGTVGES